MSWRELRDQRWLISPHLEKWQKKIVGDMRARLPSSREMLWLLSSGTQSVGSVKAIALRHESLLLSAETVNKFLSVARSDRWMLALPHYHVGGLGIYARAFVSGSEVVVQKSKWSAERFARVITKERITLTSLVPTQIFDLVEANLRSPKSLRAIVVGGGALSPELYARARELGWPLLTSYGLTECCSQVATASLASLYAREFPQMEILPHVQVELREQRVFLKSKSLCQWVAVGRDDGSLTLEDPLREGWYATSDLAEMSGSNIKILGRADDVVKILGELVPIAEVENQARKFFGIPELCVVSKSNAREGGQLILFTDSNTSLPDLENLLSDFNKTVSGPRRIKTLCWVPELPRGELGKYKKALLLEQIFT